MEIIEEQEQRKEKNKKQREKERKEKEERDIRYNKIYDKYECGRENEREGRTRLMENSIKSFGYKCIKKDIEEKYRYPLYIMYCHKHNIYLLNEQDYNILMLELVYFPEKYPNVKK